MQTSPSPFSRRCTAAGVSAPPHGQAPARRPAGIIRQAWSWMLRGPRLALLCLSALTLSCASASTEPGMVPIGDGIELAVETNGSGPIPVILVHGYSLSRGTWDRVVPKFPADRYTVHAYDLRGFGDSSKPDTGYSMHRHALDLAALMDRLQLQRAVLIGHSLGGAISQEFATLYPERVLAVISSDAFARHLPLPGVSDALRQRAESYGTLEQNRAILSAAVPRYFDPRNVGDNDIQVFLDMALKSGTPALREQLLDAYDAPALDAAKFSGMAIPVLAMSGAVDNVVPVGNAIALSDIVPDSEIALVPRTGHTPMWEQPDAWMRPVLDFLGRRVTAP